MIITETFLFSIRGVKVCCADFVLGEERCTSDKSTSDTKEIEIEIDVGTRHAVSSRFGREEQRE